MPDSVTEAENAGNGRIPSYISKLKTVDNNEQSREDSTEANLEELMEQKRMFNHVKSFCHVSLTGKYFRTIS